jgi:tRNA-specific 2-thiouridylase
MLSSSTLENVMFPLGTISKPEVRQIAADLGLKTAFKKDSQDICFVGKKNYRNFVDKRIDISTSGDIVNSDGSNMFQHDGVHEFTVGQRKGIPCCQ